MKQPLADVALPVPLHQTFTYLIPLELVAVLKVGNRVLVPFGKKKLTGIVVAFPEGTTVSPLRPIHDVLDVDPSISEELLRLSNWMAEYYSASRGEVLKAFLPQGISLESKRIVSLVRGVTGEELRSIKHSAPQRARVIQALGSGRFFSIGQLRKKTSVKNIHSILSQLFSLGLITLSEEISRPAIPKKQKFVLKKPLPEQLNLRGASQQRLLAKTLELDEKPYPVSTLLQETNSTLSSLKKLATKGLVEIVEQEVERKPRTFYLEEVKPSFQLTAHQTAALDRIFAAIRQEAPKSFLLHGITGSGKTHVYIEAIRETLSRGKTAIVLVPEISLTPQIVQRFRHHFGESVVAMHSHMSTGERYDAWRFTKFGKYKIAIGPRSAVFAPLSNLGLIVVDEEHESSYKQFDATPRYNARDVALVRGQIEHAVVILGSATPSVESYHNAIMGKYTLLSLPERVDTALLPGVTVVNMAEEQKRRFAEMKERAKTIGKRAFGEGFHSISKLLEKKIHERLEKKEGIILLQNRRGFAPFMECLECGHVERCEDCDVTMTYHITKKHLRCHYCGSVRPVPDVCPRCSGVQLRLQGFGTQRVEQDLTALFPNASLLRMDLDTTTRKGSHDRLLQKFANGSADILLGTQMVAKGLDFPRVTLVGVISADTQMLLPDFRSAERTFQLLTQVAGRAGRSSLRGEVIIQTYQVDHYCLKHVVDHDFIGFYTEELRFREEATYPPFSRIILLEFRGEHEKRVEEASEIFATELRKIDPPAVLLGPSAAVIARIRGNYRWHLLLKTDHLRDKSGMRTRAAVMSVKESVQSRFPPRSSVKIIVDVDPQGIL